MYAKIFIAGYIGRDAEVRHTPNGTAVARFSVATSERRTGQDGQQHDRTVWWRVSLWGKPAEELSQSLKKGSQVFVEGRMDPDPETGGPRLWTGRDGRCQASFEVVARSVKLVPRYTGVARFDDLRDEDIPPEAHIGESSERF